MKKKLIFVTEALWIGGIETALINLLNKLDYDKYDVTLLVCCASLELLDRVNSNCRVRVVDREKVYSASRKYRYTKLYHLTEEPENPSRLHRALMWSVPAIKWIENRLYIRYIRKLLRREKYDTVVIYSDRVAEIAVRSIRADKYLLFYHHGLIEKRYHDEIAYKRSTAIITVSQNKADELKKFRPEYAKKIIAIHNLVDIDSVLQKSKAQQTIEFQSDSFNLVTCGRLSYPKAIDWAIDACKQLVDKGYRDIHWWVVGGGPEEEMLKKMVREANLENWFHLLGMQNNPYPFILNADLYVQPSRYENYSVVILEAMTLCKPILATYPAAKEQIISGKNGRLCEADPNRMAEAIESLYFNCNERLKYVAYLKSHTLEQANEQIMKALYDLF